MRDLAIVVPVMRRPKNAAPFVASLSASCPGRHTVYAVADPDDQATIAAWKAEGATVLISERGHRFANKAQHAYLNTSEPWLLLVGDDVKFHPGWRQAADIEAADPHCCLISTNDLRNPNVAAGTCAIHPIMRRAWVDTSGACWDGPGHIAHEGYEHAFVDMEWSTKALDEGVYRTAVGCVIEHMHPVWKLGRWDRTYRKGMATTERDGELYERRKANR